MGKSDKYSSSEDSGSSSNSSNPESEKFRKEMKKLKKKIKKEQRKRDKRLKKKLKSEKKKHKKSMKSKDNEKETKSISTSQSSSDTSAPAVEKSSNVPIGLMEKSKAMAPMTKEEWEKRQSVVRRVLDEESGRYRLIKGDGEVLEEIVSKKRHVEINRQATMADGAFFQSQTVKK